MNRIEQTLLLFAFAALSCSAEAVTSENRYDTITDRNIFRLNTPPVVTSPTNSEAVLERKIDLSGISNDGGHKKAWFVVAPKAGSKDLPLYLNLAEGEMADFLTVVSIAEEEGEVKILNSGNSMVLSLKNNSLKAQPVAPMPLAPAASPVAHTPTPQPVAPPQPPTASYANNASYGNAAATYNNGSYGNRGGVTVSGGTPTLPTASGQPVENSGLRSIPTRTLRLAPVPTQQPSAPPVDAYTQRILMEAQQEEARQTGRQLPPLPPLP